MITFDYERFLTELEQIVNIDSGSTDARGVNKVQDWFEDRYTQLGWKTTTYDIGADRGRALLFSESDNHNFDILVACHVDTVFPKGEAVKRPFSIDSDSLRGPGVADMKAGCLFTLYAVEDIIKSGKHGNIGLFYNSDEELSSAGSRPFLEALIKKSKIAITGESADVTGNFVNRRKGISRYNISFTGVAAHAGVAPQNGACAVEEMAHWIIALKSFVNFDNGISVNTGIACGGSTVNSVPDYAAVSVDVRAMTIEELNSIDEKIRSINIHNPKVIVSIEGGVTRPPMTPTDKTDALCRLAENIGARYGIKVGWESAGGGSDASFAPALGVPAICNLTPMNRAIHSPDEALLLKEIHERYAIYRDIIREFSLLW